VARGASVAPLRNTGKGKKFKGGRGERAAAFTQKRAKGRSAAQWGKRSGAGGAAGAVFGTARGVTAAETHYFDATSVTAVSSGGQVLLLNAMAQGPDFDERIGNKIVMKSVEWRMRLSNIAAEGCYRTPVRLLFVYDRQANGAALTGAMVLDAFSTTSLKLVANRDRFLILRDELIDWNTFGAGIAGDSGVDEVQIQRKGFIPLKGLPTTYNAAAAAIGSVTTGSLYALIVGGTTSNMNMVLNTRLRYDA